MAGNNVAQNVTVSAAQDNNGRDEQTDITFSAPGLTSRLAGISVLDDDNQAIEVLPTGSLVVTEGQSTTFTVRLALDPITPMQLDLTSSAPSAGVISPSTLSFNSGNFNGYQTITFTALQDADARDNNVLVTINTNPSGLATPLYLGVQIQDDEVQELVFTPSSLTIDEGSAGSFLVSMAYPPAGNVTVSLNSTNPGLAAVSPQLIFFTPVNYSQPQTISVSTFTDEDGNDDIAAIAVTATGLSPQTMNITVRDTVSQSIVASPSSIALTEGQAGQDLAIRLAVQPSANVQVFVASGNPSVVQVSSSALSFTAANWNTPQTVRLTTPNDSNTDNENSSVVLTVAGLPPMIVPVSVTDDDQQSIIATPTSISVNEGQTTNLGVRLAYAPSAATTVTIGSLDPTIATVSIATLTFTQSN
ncbi:MAG TPA: hypothetical protein EYN66_04580, partial [Myxococcales bacterium]|nr:hypothetical protein [Myxococcales bacterium]